MSAVPVHGSRPDAGNKGRNSTNSDPAWYDKPVSDGIPCPLRAARQRLQPRSPREGRWRRSRSVGSTARPQLDGRTGVVLANWPRSIEIADRGSDFGGSGSRIRHGSAKGWHYGIFYPEEEPPSRPG